jgi:hypothetical protein
VEHYVQTLFGAERSTTDRHRQISTRALLVRQIWLPYLSCAFAASEAD